MKKTVAVVVLAAGIVGHSLVGGGALENNAEWVAVEVPSGIGQYELIQSYNPDLSKRKVRKIAKAMTSDVYNEDSYIQGEFKLQAGATVLVPIVK